MGNTGMDRFSCRRKLRRLDAELIVVGTLAAQAAAGQPTRRATRGAGIPAGTGV